MLTTSKLLFSDMQNFKTTFQTLYVLMMILLIGRVYINRRGTHATGGRGSRIGRRGRHASHGSRIRIAPHLADIHIQYFQ